MKELKEKDLRLLAYLYSHNREPLTKIAKNLKISRQQVEYKLKEYLDNKLIEGFIPIINYPKLNYNSFCILLIKLKKQSYLKQFQETIKNNANKINTVEILGKYDLGLAMIFKNEQEKNQEILKLLEKYKTQIESNVIISPYKMQSYPLKFAGNKSESSYSQIENSEKIIKLDEKELNILKILNKNGRAKLLAIATKTNLSPELAFYKIKKLEKEKILLGTRAILNMEKLGFHYTILQISLKNISNELTKKVEAFCKNQTHIETFYFNIEKPNLYIQLFHKTEEQLRNTIEEIKEAFSEQEMSIEILPIKSEGKQANPLPFL
ncbi:winged helix-turn-helix transcriptional regulator [Candidatus Pacearchaeota archaeon]|nr:winged helix-turn-helix transcriptional regulator [Candidatus Pacearchaeota archaeon]